MGYVLGEDRSQIVLFPECLDDYIQPDNPIRFVEAFVERLDLGELGFQKLSRKNAGGPLMTLGSCCGYTSRLLDTYGRVGTGRERNERALMWLMGKPTPTTRRSPLPQRQRSRSRSVAGVFKTVQADGSVRRRVSGSGREQIQSV